jgi:hypothetical protein
MVCRTPWSHRSQVLREDLVLFAIKACRTVTVSQLVLKSVLAQTPSLEWTDQTDLACSGSMSKHDPISELHLLLLIRNDRMIRPLEMSV